MDPEPQEVAVDRPPGSEPQQVEDDDEAEDADRPGRLSVPVTGVQLGASLAGKLSREPVSIASGDRWARRCSSFRSRKRRGVPDI